MAGFTNKGKFELLRQHFRGSPAKPTNVYVALVTSAAAPGPDTNTMSQLTEIAAGNNYTSGGFSLSLNSTDFDAESEDDTLDKAYVQIKDVAWTASGGSIPASGDGARYAVLLDDTGTTVGQRQVLAYWDLSSDRSVSDGQTLTLQDLQLNLTET